MAEPFLTEAGNLSNVRHGTASGWRKHQKDGTGPCDACVRARSEYDRRRLEAPEATNRNRLTARAQHLALMRLMRAHKTEYDVYYIEAKGEVGL